MAYTLKANKFLGTLSQLITRIVMNDTLSGRGVDKLLAECEGERLEHGGAFAVNSADLPAVEDYDDTMSPLTRVKPTIDQQFIEITDYKVVRISVNRWLTATAFLDALSLAEFMGYVITTLQGAKRSYMYKLVVNKIETWAPARATQTLTIDLIDTSSMTDPVKIESANVLNAKTIAKKLMKLIREFDAPTKKFNDLGYEEMIDPAKMDLFINSKFDVDLIADTYATLFHSEEMRKQYLWSKDIGIPEDQLTGNNKANYIGLLAHKGKITYGYGYEVQTSFFNPATLDENNFLHFNYYIDSVKGLPAVKIVANYVSQE